MKKLFSVAIALFFLTSVSNAQFDIGASLSIPSGAIVDVFDLGMGFGATVQYGISKDGNLSYGGTGSFYYYTSDLLTMTVIPVQSFAKYYLADNIYGIGKFGYSVIGGTVEGGGVFSGNSGISYGLGAGIELGMFEVGASYDFL
ncbi:MAG: hypothetical protein K9G34_09705, partial [Melioribacteraceae bacterium]|nr:hypothetical protein [Melioribacteraceae bacterium]